MRLYRCYPRIPGARTGRPGHWRYVPRPQQRGRWDNAELYDSWYFSRSPIGAIAESFYNKRRWIPEVFLTPTGDARALASFEFTGELPLLDFDDAAVLLEFGMRPSQVVAQDLTTTQQLARRVYERDGGSISGLSWWSSQLPSETSVMLWGSGGAPPQGLRLMGIESLSVEHPAVIETAERLYRVLG